MYSLGFNYLSRTRFSIDEMRDINTVLKRKEIKMKRFKKTKKNQREVQTLTYFKLPFSELEAMILPDNLPKTPKTLAVYLEKENQLGENLIGILKTKILFAMKLMSGPDVEENLLLINKIILKAKSVFIHLSVAEEGEMHYTMKFVKEHPFNDFVPDLLNYLTTEAPSVRIHFNL